MRGRRQRGAARLRETHLVFAFASGRAPLRTFDAFHRHDEIELLYLEQGEARQLIRGQLSRIPSRRLLVFWGAIPHWHASDAPETIVHWLTIPLAWFLSWRLPEGFTRAILEGQVLAEGDERRSVLDLALFTQWHADLRTRTPDARELVQREVEVRLRRLAAAQPRTASTGRRSAFPAPASAGEVGAVERMATFVAHRFRDALSVPTIAAQVDLHPDYASALFKRAFGVRLTEYIVRLRVAHAQQVLAISDSSILDVALASGFASQSRFYEAFTRICGMTPRAYRVSARSGGNADGWVGVPRG